MPSFWHHYELLENMEIYFNVIIMKGDVYLLRPKNSEVVCSKFLVLVVRLICAFLTRKTSENGESIPLW